MTSITITDPFSASPEARRPASLNGILATMGGLAVAIDLLGLENIVDAGQWLQPVVVSCTREEAEVLADLVNDLITEAGSEAGSIIFQQA